MLRTNMAPWPFKAIKCPDEELSLTNRIIVNRADIEEDVTHVSVLTSAIGPPFLCTVQAHPGIQSGEIAFSATQRKWASIMLRQEVGVRKFAFDKKTQTIGTIVVEMDFWSKKGIEKTTIDSDSASAEFSMSFNNRAFTVNEPLVFKYANKFYSIRVKEIEVLDYRKVSADGKVGAKPVPAKDGLLTSNSSIIFDKVEGSALMLKGKAKSKTAHQSIINPDWDFTKLGIGGLDDEFSAIFRRAFASRVFPPEVIEQLGMKHVRGILLFGPPGTGKTLMAREISKMLNAREPQIVNGPQILDKYVGESEANIRKLFQPAEEEEKRLGSASGLHIIIFDEIDAICKSRGSVAGNTAVHDTVVNQLLTKLDGVEQLNNILVIGMTNRKDMIDEAITRPGRLEVQMEIGLPDEKGRGQILRIHTETMRNNSKLDSDVNLEQLAALTKNYTGAEIEGLVRAAQSTAMNRLIKATHTVEIDTDSIEKLMITQSDFLHAFQNDIKPALGSSKQELESFLTQGIMSWGEPVERVLNDGDLVVSQIKSSTQSCLTTMLLEGPPGTGKTALAAKIAKNADMPFTKLCTPENMIGFTEAARCQLIKKIFDDAYKSPLSCIVVDDIERLLDYVRVGPRFSNLLLQALLVLLKKIPPQNHKLLIIGTTSQKDILADFDMLPLFSTVAHVSSVSTHDQLINVLESVDALNPTELDYVRKKTDGKRVFIGIKPLLTLIEMTKQMDDGQRGDKFISLLQDQNAIDYS